MDKILEYRKLNAPHNTITRNVMDLAEQTGNIYETAVVIARRADQITCDLSQELHRKLDEFAYMGDSPEREIFQDEEQIELSRQYERMAKPALLATQEYVVHRIEFTTEQAPTDEADALSAE